ncbi:MAG: hypothetical protein FIB07_12835 [Candidatus Methanoperedens sp.]|nr:hypothetical protein [Candidatus Methanoperedens sp.]
MAKEKHVEEEESVKHAGKTHEKGAKSETAEDYKERMRNFNRELMAKVKETGGEEEEMPGAHPKTSKMAASSEEASASE